MFPNRVFFIAWFINRLYINVLNCFDGGATRRRAGFLTIHATDDKKRAHFIDATDTSGFDHTGELYANMVLRV